MRDGFVAPIGSVERVGVDGRENTVLRSGYHSSLVDTSISLRVS